MQALKTCTLTLPGLNRRNPADHVGFFEWTPFKVFFVASTLHVALLALETGRLRLVTF